MDPGAGFWECFPASRLTFRGGTVTSFLGSSWHPTSPERITWRLRVTGIARLVWAKEPDHNYRATPSSAPIVTLPAAGGFFPRN